MGTLRSSREIDAVFRSARRSSHPLVIALVTPTPQGRGPEGRVAFVAGKKLGGAVVRNRAKRVLRSVARDVGIPRPGFDVVLIARAGTATANRQDLERAVRDTLARADVCR